jgi:hypothetical protein
VIACVCACVCICCVYCRIVHVLRVTRTHTQTLNFSIAYGKTARGLAIDWETSIDVRRSVWWCVRCEFACTLPSH